MWAPATSQGASDAVQQTGGGGDRRSEVSACRVCTGAPITPLRNLPWGGPGVQELRGSWRFRAEEPRIEHDEAVPRDERREALAPLARGSRCCCCCNAIRSGLAGRG
ncbi:unnamed protein product [Lampetra fluviatilis]